MRVAPLCSMWNPMWVKTLFGWMLVLAEVQTTGALYTNESIHFNNRSPIWHRGPSSTLHPGRGSHSCFQTAVHYEPPGPRINCSDLIWPATKGRLYAKDYFPKGFASDCLRSWVLWAGDVCARPRFALGQYLQLKGEYICHHLLSLTQKCERILIETTSETPQGHWSSVQSSVKAQCFCGALEERSALRWTFCCLPKCFSVFH